MNPVPPDSFFAEHETLKRHAMAAVSEVDADVSAYLQPYVHYIRVLDTIPDRERLRLDHQWEAFIASTTGTQGAWPEQGYSFTQGYNEAYERWLSSLAPEARASEQSLVRDRFQAEYTHFVKGLLYFQILWPNPNDPKLVTPATWDDEGEAIARRYNHRAPMKEHWLLPIAEAFALYNPSKPVRVAHPEGEGLNGHESIVRPAYPPASKGGKPATDPE